MISIIIITVCFTFGMWLVAHGICRGDPLIQHPPHLGDPELHTVIEGKMFDACV